MSSDSEKEHMPKSEQEHTYELARGMVKAVVLEAKAGLGLCADATQSQRVSDGGRGSFLCASMGLSTVFEQSF